MALIWAQKSFCRAISSRRSVWWSDSKRRLHWKTIFQIILSFPRKTQGWKAPPFYLKCCWN